MDYFQYFKTPATMCDRLNSGICFLLAIIILTELCTYLILQKLEWNENYLFINKTNIKDKYFKT